LALIQSQWFKMNNIFQLYFPKFYAFAKNLYHATPNYKAKMIVQVAEEAELTSQIMKEVFEDQYEIQNGPFKGMKYINRSSGSSLLPKILGSYEEPIQDWVSEVIESVYVKKYLNILDIGCAEGYYAAGFAMKLPDSKIWAYDIDEVARNNANELAALNGLHNIEIKAECTHEELNSKCQPDTLVFCDIEGYEKHLLDPLKVPNLRFVDLIIESHDCFVPNITDILIERFYMTHTMRIVVDYPYRVNKYTTPKTPTKDQRHYITDEKRRDYMKFIYMESIVGKM
jgi:hypothetical protein